MKTNEEIKLAFKMKEWLPEYHDKLSSLILDRFFKNFEETWHELKYQEYLKGRQEENRIKGIEKYKDYPRGYDVADKGFSGHVCGVFANVRKKYVISKRRKNFIIIRGLKFHVKGDKK